MKQITLTREQITKLNKIVDQFMKYLYLMCISALLCNVSYAEEKTNIVKIFDDIVAYAPKDGTTYKLEYSKTIKNMGEALYSNRLFYKTCTVIVNQNDISNKSENDLAFIFGHEVAHCVLKHNRFVLQHLNIVQQQYEYWKQEYDADRKGLDLALLAGYNAQEGAEHILHDTGSDISHPPGYARLVALNEGHRE
jgi:hypothetical protein